MAKLAFCDYHNMVAILEKTEHNVDFHQIFWSTAKVKTVDGETHLIAKVNGKQRAISESSIWRHLKLNDEEAKISHRAQGIAALASRWHTLASCSTDDRSHMRFSHSKGNLEAGSSLMRSVSLENDMEAMNYAPLPTNAQLTSYLSSYHRRQSFRK
ncbi:kinase-like domain-containing protein [Tanacetum coccineum]